MQLRKKLPIYRESQQVENCCSSEKKSQTCSSQKRQEQLSMTEQPLLFTCLISSSVRKLIAQSISNINTLIKKNASKYGPLPTHTILVMSRFKYLLPLCLPASSISKQF